MLRPNSILSLLWSLAFLISLVGPLAFLDADAQEVAADELRVDKSAWAPDSVLPVGAGSGERISTQRTPCLSDEARAQIQAALAASRRDLQRRGILPETPVSKQSPSLAWPLKLKDGLTDPGYHGISNYVDLDPRFPDILLDFQCGGRSYDLDSGYNHQGIDFFTWPFSWKKMEENAVEIIAAAPGTIILKSDGNFDRNCGFGGGNWNAVYIEHADGSVIYYGHMRSGSLTTKLVGQTVAAGEYLGVIGSSGSSTGPHLHMETWSAQGNLIEPYFGPCNNLNPASWWSDQRPYYDSAINALRTNILPPEFPACPAIETPNERTQFVPGSLILFMTYYRDQRINQLSTYTILRPDGSVFSTWTHSSPNVHWAASYWWWSFTINGPLGTWKFRVEFEGQVEEHEFQMVTVPVEPRSMGSIKARH